MKTIISVLVFGCVVVQAVWAQPKGRFDGQREAALAQPFKGIFYLDIPPANLFPIKRTGVSTEPVRQAAKAFLASPSAADRKKTAFPVDDLEWRKWDNRHRYARQGVGFDKMTRGQRELAFNLLKASLSAPRRFSPMRKARPTTSARRSATIKCSITSAFAAVN